MTNTKLRSFLVAVFLILFAFVLAGCGSDDTTNPSTSTPSSTNEPQTSEPVEPASTSKTVDVTMYFPTSDAAGLVATQRSVTVKEETSEDVIEGIFKEFSNPPSGLVAPLPKGTELLDVKIKDGVATLNLSHAFRDNFEGGSTGEQMVLYSIVNSLTTLDDVDSVEFLLEGELKAAILGELDTSVPVTANEGLIVKQ